jgi:rhodanese-related sulfurtransferase
MFVHHLKQKFAIMEAQIRHYQDKLAYEMDAADLFEALEAGEKVVVVDTRKPFGYQAEHIPGAINLPQREMNELTTAHLDREALFVTYCDGIGCNGSTKGALKMAQLGFKVKELLGGIEWWKFDGYATEGEKANPAGKQVQCAC